MNVCATPDCGGEPHALDLCTNCYRQRRWRKEVHTFRHKIDYCGEATEWGCGQKVRDGQDCVLVIGAVPWSSSDPAALFHRACKPSNTVPAFLRGLMRELRARAASC